MQSRNFENHLPKNQVMVAQIQSMLLMTTQQIATIADAVVVCAEAVSYDALIIVLDSQGIPPFQRQEAVIQLGIARSFISPVNADRVQAAAEYLRRDFLSSLLPDNSAPETQVLRALIDSGASITEVIDTIQSIELSMLMAVLPDTSTDKPN